MTVTRRGTKLPDNYKSFTIKAGVLAGATYPQEDIKNAKTGKVRPDPRAGMPVAVIAAALNYGTANIPARPFMNMTIAQQSKTWVDNLVLMLKNDIDFEQALTIVAQTMKEDIKQTINDWPADNSKEWAESKGFSKGLIFTSHLLNSIDYAISEKGRAL